MIKRLLKSGNSDKIEKGKELLAVELSEIKEIAEMIFERIDKRMDDLKKLEASLDEKILILERLIERAENIRPSIEKDLRHNEIIALRKRGLKIDEISDILDMPVGEVELILNLYSTKS